MEHNKEESLSLNIDQDKIDLMRSKFDAATKCIQAYEEVTHLLNAKLIEATNAVADYLHEVANYKRQNDKHQHTVTVYSSKYSPEDILKGERNE